MELHAPKGTQDLLPSESYRWQYIERVIRRITAAYHFREVRIPTFEHTELFLRGVGDTTDVVQKEMYTFLDKGDRSITLRPEGTAGVTRAFLEHGLYAGPQPTKMYYLGLSVFRYEKPQAGRLREHHQFGVELFGAKDASADGEVISLALQVLNTLGIHHLTLYINSIGCPHCRPTYNQALKEYFEDKKDRLCGTCKERLEKNTLRLLDCKVESCKEIVKDAPVIQDYLCDECKAHFAALQAYLREAGIDFEINPLIVRGLDYYTKTVFEIVSSEIGAQGTVCGGGRYDGLIQQVGGPAMPGVGFGMGMERLLMVMDQAGVQIPKEKPLVAFLCTMGDEARKVGFQFLGELRKAGISADMDHCQRSLKAQMKYAGKQNARFAIMIGEEELQTGIYRLRDMKKSEERVLDRTALLETLVREA